MYFSDTAFYTGCVDLLQVWDSLEPEDRLESAWEDVRLVKSTEPPYMRIFRRLQPKPFTGQEPARANNNGDQEPYDSDFEFDDDDNDNDDEEVRRAPASSDLDSFVVIYDLVYSISYQSPVIYLTFRNSFGLPWVPSLDFLHTNLVPPSQISAIQDAPVNGAAFGALSMSDHPVTNTPAFFVHPCRTNEALQNLSSTTESLGAVEKLFKFIGLIGIGVGLVVPIPVAAAIVHRSQYSQAL